MGDWVLCLGVSSETQDASDVGDGLTGKTAETPQPGNGVRHRVWRDVGLYLLARTGTFIALWAMIAGLAWMIGAPVPLLISALLAIVVLFPLSFLLFQDLRGNVVAGMAQWGAQRAAHRQWVQKEIEGRQD